MNRYNAEWISVENKLPEEDGKYLVTMLNGDARHVTMRYFRAKGYRGGANNKELGGVSSRDWHKTQRGYPWSKCTCGVIAWAYPPLPY